MTSCTVKISDIGLIPLAALKAYKQEVDQAKDPDAKDAPKMRPTKLFDFFTDFRDYLHATYGSISGRPLSYVIRNEIAVPLDASDPAFKVDGSRYYSYQHEIEHQVPINIIDS